MRALSHRTLARPAVTTLEVRLLRASGKLAAVDSISKDLSALDAEGRSVSLTSLAQDGPVLIAFLRHFG